MKQMRAGAAAWVVAMAAVATMAGPAVASTMPGADDTGVCFGAGVGYGGLAVSLDAPTGSPLRLGASVGSGNPFGSPLSFDIRGTYRLPDVGVPHLALDGIAGLVGGLGYGSTFPHGGVAGLEAGFGAAYHFVPRLVGRVNLVYGIPFYGAFPWYGAPASGLEFGYEFSKQLEGTVGWSGLGENVGIRVRS